MGAYAYYCKRIPYDSEGMMQGSPPIGKMNVVFARTNGKHFIDNDGRIVRADNSKPRIKRNYTQARKLKEKGYVFS